MEIAGLPSFSTVCERPPRIAEGLPNADAERAIRPLEQCRAVPRCEPAEATRRSVRTATFDVPDPEDRGGEVRFCDRSALCSSGDAAMPIGRCALGQMAHGLSGAGRRHDVPGGGDAAADGTLH